MGYSLYIDILAMKESNQYMVSQGTARKYTAHKGSWGDGFIIEKSKEPRRKVSCSDCKYYCDDGSCMKEPVMIAEVGYDNWKICRSFMLHGDVQNFKDKKDQVGKKRGLYYVEKQETVGFEQKAIRDGMGINFWDIEDSVKEYFLLRYKNKKNSSANQAYSYVPREMYEGFKIFIEWGDSKLYEDALAVMIRDFGARPGKKGIRRMKRESLKYIVQLLFTGRYVGYNVQTFDELVCDFFADYLHTKQVY